LKEKIEKVADFYQRVLLKQPVQCVQIQRGNEIEQVFEYLERDCDWNHIRPVTIAPIPHLVMASRSPSFQYQAKCFRQVTTTMDGWGYIKNDCLKYRIPDIPRVKSYGLNIYANLSNFELYQEAYNNGCKTMRLLCDLGSDDRWDWDNLEPNRQRLIENLEWARAAGGLKVGIELHWKWLPEGLYGEKGYSDPARLAEFIKRWQTIIEWAKPYHDVVGWFDLQNEPNIAYERESITPYYTFKRKAVKSLRPVAEDIPIMVEVTNGADPGALRFWEDLGDANLIVGYHDYWPHMFTHQRSVEPGDPHMPAVFFPSFMPMIQWTTPS